MYAVQPMLFPPELLSLIFLSFRLRETEEKVKQLQDDLDKAIRSKEQLYHQLDELQVSLRQQITHFSSNHLP